MTLEDRPEGLVTPETVTVFQPAGAAPSAKSSWRLRDLLLFILFVPVGLITANLLVLLGYTLLAHGAHWHLAKDQLSANPFFLLALQTIFYGLTFAWVYFLVAVNRAQPFWPALRWRRIAAGKILVCFAGGALMTFLVALLPPVLPDSSQFPLENLFNSRAAAFAVGTFAITIAPLMEEIIFRGFLFAIFESLAGLPSAVLLTALLFGGLHIPEYWGAWNHMFLIFLVGLVFSLVRGASGSLAPSVFLHMGYNASMMVGLFVSTEQFRNFHALPHP